MGAVMLLLYAVRMVQTGIERAFGASFQRVITKNDNPFRSAAMGTILAMVLQSSAAVALLTAGFASVGTLSFAAGLAVVLGADFGSAIVVQLLSFRLDWLVPILLATGGWFFVKTDRRILKQAGRILLGIAFILLSLRFLRETMDPIRDSAFLPAIAAYLENDFLTAFLIGGAVAVLMHSSVAVVLMCVTLVAIEAITLAAGIFNIGGTSVKLIGVQMIGIAACFLWVFPVAFLMFKLIDKTVGLRVSREEEIEGLDFTEHGGNAYPDFEVSSHGGVALGVFGSGGVQGKKISGAVLTTSPIKVI